jgi:hypothetical protein
MEFITAVKAERNLGQDTLWTSVQVAFPNEEGIAFLSYPIYRQDGLLLHTPDVLLILRRYGIFILESKGCHIEQIRSIEGPRWSMQGWHSDAESPVEQVNQQMFALKDILERNAAIAGMLRINARVALPLVRESDWHQRGFDKNAAAGNVICQEGCTPQQLRNLVEACHQRYPQQQLDETQWAILLQQFQGTTSIEHDKLPVIRYVYSESPPTAEVIAERLNITLNSLPESQSTFTYVTATAALAARRKREGFGQRHQVDPRSRPNDPNAGQPHLVFHNVLRVLLNTQVLTRAEEQTLVTRAAHVVANENAAAAAALRRDVFAWRDALREFDERGFDLRNGLPAEVANRIVHPGVAHVLVQLQKEYRRLQDIEEKKPFEAAARAFLEYSFRPTPLIVMEGFSRFTPLQLLFIDRCLHHGARVVFIHPYSAEQALGFEAIHSTYANWWKEPPVTIQTPTFDSPESLVTLKTRLFSHRGNFTPPNDGAVLAEAYAHRNREVAACVQRVNDYLKEGREARDITIISRDPAGYNPLILEEAELHGIADRFAIPPRNLLLTPLGRCVLTLYNVWQDSAIDLSADAFETILASGWLGSKAQASADAFAMATPQLFARCHSYEDWITVLQVLEDASLRINSRLPIASVSKETCRLWRVILNQVVQLCRNLFSAGHQSIGRHIRLLLDELEQLNPQSIRDAERQVLVRLEEVLLPLTEGASIGMTAKEFGTILANLGYEDADEVEDQPQQVAVTSPEGIDGTERRIVFYLGADDRSLPRPYSDPWPLYENQLDAHITQERYLFLAVARAATERLHLSYSLVANSEACRPSLYLEEATSLINLSISQDVEESVGSATAHDVQPAPIGAVWRPRYILHEIAHFFLCPYRYHLERLDPKARRYHLAWQVPFIAKAIWLRHTLGLMCKREIQAPRPSEFLTMALEHMNSSERRVRSLFSGLRDLDWLSVRRDVEHELTWQLTKRFSDTTHPFRVTINEAPQTTYEIPIGDRHITVTAPADYVFQVGRFNYPYVTDTRDEEWLRYGSGEPNNNEPLAPSADLGIIRVEGLDLFESLYDAMTWWNRGMTRALWRELKPSDPEATNKYDAFSEDIQARIPVLQAGLYPKNPGHHCFYCPVRGECLGLNP